MYDFAHDADPQAAGYGAPPLLLTAAEALRFPVELTSSLVSDLVWPPRRAVGEAPRPVLVLPGFMADDPLTARLRSHLRRHGYAAHGWGLGRNVGLTDEIVAGVLERFDEVAATAPGTPVSLVGWSFGGLLARWTAHQRPGRVRQVVALGSPWRAEGERTRATAMFERAAVRHGLSARARDIVDELRRPLDVPVSAIWSRSDGIAHWRGCRVADGARAGAVTEDVEVLSSHVGLVSNPLALAALVDRLAQDPDDWRPFSWREALARRARVPQSLAPRGTRPGTAA
jgi:pimeloyl-ACP methyl ester carboxylesterase